MPSKIKKHPLYSCWRSMKRRCRRKDKYKNYGGRGIVVCERWKTFQNFIDDMGSRPEGTTIERIDNNLGYCKENCKWATRAEQSNNKRNNRVIVIENRRQNLFQWIREVGIKPGTFYLRMKLGWPIEKALTHPVRKSGTLDLEPRGKLLH